MIASLDVDQFNALRANLNPTILAAIIAEFVADSEVQISAIGTGLLASHTDGAGQAAHQLRGMAANLGGSTVTDLAARIERACETGNIEHAADLLVRLRPAAEALWAAIDRELNTTPGVPKGVGFG